MSFQWQDFLGLAEEVHKNHNVELEEAALCTVISRANYATFHYAATYLRKEYYRVPKDGSAHTYVYEAFEGSPMSEEQRIVRIYIA